MKHLTLIILLLTTVFVPGKTPASEPEDFINVGGALRFNYNLSSWKDGQKKRLGDFGYDMFRINVLGSVKGIRINSEYRFYAPDFGGGMLKQGWFAIDLSENSEMQLGLQQVPFGIQQYNSHNWFFNLTYYLGFEDDHDMGIKYIFDKGSWQVQTAFYLNAEDLVFGDVPASPNRYSYDVAGRNKETNQMNIKTIYRTGHENQVELGMSLQGGLLYNLDTGKSGNHLAGAFHAEALPLSSKWGIKTQLMTYQFRPEGGPGEDPDIIEMGAYGSVYNVAASGTIISAAISRRIVFNERVIDAITLYNDFALLKKNISGFENTFMNVAGAMIAAGPLYIYADMALGYNHPWLGPEWTNSLSSGTDGPTRWHSRFNINFGYYF